MQHQKGVLKEKVLVGFLAMVWVSGLILAGSDGPLMPYLNLWGGLQFFGSSCLLGRLLPRLDSSPRAGMLRPGLKQRTSLGTIASCRKSARTKRTQDTGGIQPSFARELGIV